MRKFRWIFVALLLLPATAHANRWTDATVQTAITVADNHWPDSSCYGRHDITWLRGTELDALFSEDRTEGTVMARASFGEPCKVWVAWDRIDPAFIFRPGIVLCSILEHEFGHNAGLEHSDDPKNVMYAVFMQPASDCVAAFPAVNRKHRRHR